MVLSSKEADEKNKYQQKIIQVLAGWINNETENIMVGYFNPMILSPTLNLKGVVTWNDGVYRIYNDSGYASFRLDDIYELKEQEQEVFIR